MDKKEFSTVAAEARCFTRAVIPVLAYLLIILMGAAAQGCPELPGYDYIPALAMPHFEASLFVPAVPVQLNLTAMAEACNTTSVCGGFDTLNPPTADTQGRPLAVVSRYLRMYITLKEFMMTTAVLDGSSSTGCQGTFVKTRKTFAALNVYNDSLCKFETPLGYRLEGYRFYEGVTFGIQDHFFPYPTREDLIRDAQNATWDTVWNRFFPKRFSHSFLSNIFGYSTIPDFRIDVPGEALVAMCADALMDCWGHYIRCIPCLGISTKHGVLIEIPPVAQWYKFTDTPCHGLYVREHELVASMSYAIRSLLEKDQSKWPALFGSELDMYPKNMLITRRSNDRDPIYGLDRYQTTGSTWQIAVNITHAAVFGDNATVLEALEGTAMGWDISITCRDGGWYSGLPPLTGPRWQLSSFTVRNCNMSGALPPGWLPPAMATDYSGNQLSGELPAIGASHYLLPKPIYTEHYGIFTCLNLSNNNYGGHIPDSWLLGDYQENWSGMMFDISGNKLKPLKHDALKRMCQGKHPSRVYFSREDALDVTFPPSAINFYDQFFAESIPQYAPLCKYYFIGRTDRVVIADNGTVSHPAGSRYVIRDRSRWGSDYPHNMCPNRNLQLAIGIPVVVCAVLAVLVAVVLYRPTLFSPITAMASQYRPMLLSPITGFTAMASQYRLVWPIQRVQAPRAAEGSETGPDEPLLGLIMEESNQMDLEAIPREPLSHSIA